MEDEFFLFTNLPTPPPDPHLQEADAGSSQSLQFSGAAFPGFEFPVFGLQAGDRGSTPACSSTGTTASSPSPSSTSPPPAIPVYPYEEEALHMHMHNAIQTRLSSRTGLQGVENNIMQIQPLGFDLPMFMSAELLEPLLSSDASRVSSMAEAFHVAGGQTASGASGSGTSPELVHQVGNAILPATHTCTQTSTAANPLPPTPRATTPDPIIAETSSNVGRSINDTPIEDANTDSNDDATADSTLSGKEAYAKAIANISRRRRFSEL
ncbi:hypothetical protein HK102_008848, partial [Quaeritorhiza haematococci]